MNNRIVKLYIKGYFRDEIRCRFPKARGIYFIYRGALNSATRKCTLKELLYIDDSSNIYDSLNEHDSREIFLRALGHGEMLFYTFALTDISKIERERIKYSLVYELAPVCNTKHTPRLGASTKTRIEILGDRHAFLPNVIEVQTY